MILLLYKLVMLIGRLGPPDRADFDLAVLARLRPGFGLGQAKIGQETKSTRMH